MRLDEVPERLTLLTEWPTLDDGCVEEIEAWIEAVENPRLIVIDSDAPDLKAALKAMGGVDVVYDPVGGPAFDAALRATLDVVNIGGECGIEEGLQYETAQFGLMFATDDMREGTRAFMERRKPTFTGR